MYSIWMGSTTGRGCVLYAKNIKNWSDAVATLALYGSYNRSGRFRLTSHLPNRFNNDSMNLVIAKGTGEDAYYRWRYLITDKQRFLAREWIAAKDAQAKAERTTGRNWHLLRESLNIPAPEKKQPKPVVVKKWEKERIRREAEEQRANELEAARLQRLQDQGDYSEIIGF